MAPHLTSAELADLRKWASEGSTPKEILKLHRQSRRQSRMKPLCMTAVRKALRGKTHRGGEETRGAKRKLSQRAVQALDKKRRSLVDKYEGAREVPWAEVIKKARVKKVHPTTARRSLQNAGIPVASRRNREKPQRKAEHIQERLETCGRWRFLPKDFFAEQVDVILDNKKFEVPTTQEARHFKGNSKVRFQIRTRQEGLRKNYTKPNPKRNRRNLGGKINVCAGVRNNRIVLWKYLEGKWNGEAAAEIYNNDIKKLFQRVCPNKARPTILEDNDPTGYKSGVAVAAKRRLKYNVLPLPRYSPDLNPLDFCIWADIERRALNGSPKTGRESVEAYKVRLRKVAMATSRAMIKRAVLSMSTRVQAVYDAEGGHIARD